MHTFIKKEFFTETSNHKMCWSQEMSSNLLILVHVKESIANIHIQSIFQQDGTEPLNVSWRMDIMIQKWMYGAMVVYFLKWFQNFRFSTVRVNLIRFIASIKSLDHHLHNFWIASKVRQHTWNQMIGTSNKRKGQVFKNFFLMLQNNYWISYTNF